MIASIPSPSSGAIHVGPLQLRAYGLCIALGVWAAVAVCSRRYARRGGDPGLITTIAVWAVPAGILGARLYHVVTHYELYLPPAGHPLNALKMWDGGLGIWGGVAAGLIVGAQVARRHGANLGVLFDCVAPALPLAQAIGLWGNFFNQELFGKPTSLPWDSASTPRTGPLSTPPPARSSPSSCTKACGTSAWSGSSSLSDDVSGSATGRYSPSTAPRTRLGGSSPNTNASTSPTRSGRSGSTTGRASSSSLPPSPA